MYERLERNPLLGSKSAQYRELKSVTDTAINYKLTRFLWLFSVASFTLSTILLFSSPFVLTYLEVSGINDIKPCNQAKSATKNFFNGSEPLSILSKADFKQFSGQSFYNSFQEPKETFLIKFKVTATRFNFNRGNYSSVQLVSIGATSYRRFLARDRFPNATDFSISEIQKRQESLAKSIRDFHSHEVLINKLLAAREALGPIKKDAEKIYIIEFIGLCRKELSLKVFSQESLQLTDTQRYHIRRWRDGRQLGLEESKIKKPAYELINVVNSGPPENRIDVVFMGDGYTHDERDKFVKDITRLSTEMFEGETFRPWLPLINVWAVFAPSNESGIGTGGVPKDTPFGLYRDGTELRGIYTSKPEVAQSICKELGPALCDFPSLIANDDFYGGLGGEYIISTRSIKSGTVVLRHEMGHTFNDVGEEYDGGEVYEGVNSAASLDTIPWRHWINGDIQKEKNHLVFQKYPWYDLSKNGPYVVNFNTSGKFPRWYLQISTSGMAKKGSFRVTLDGAELPWSPPGTLDRTFSAWFNDTNRLARGSHNLRFEAQKNLPEGKIIHQLCNIELMEYASENKFNWKDPDHVDAYPTYNYKGDISYRPTNEYCLMRNMTSAHFCPVCKEGLWLKFLERVSLVDELDIRLLRFSGLTNPTGIIPEPDHRHFTFGDNSDNLLDTSNFSSGYLVQLNLLGVAPLPKGNALKWPSTKSSKNTYKILWYHNSRRIYFLDGQTSFLVFKHSPFAVGVWEVVVTFTTPQVRKDPNHLLTAHELFILKRPA